MNNFVLGALTMLVLWMTFSEPPAGRSELGAICLLWFFIGAALATKVLAWSIETGKNGVFQKIPPTGGPT